MQINRLIQNNSHEVFEKKKDLLEEEVFFVQSNHKPGKYPCQRYKITEQMLSSTDKYSVDLIRAILSVR